MKTSNPYYSHSSYSREATGFIGIKNQGATCYMNSLLQALFHLGLFRRSVYKIPTDANTKSIPHALQALFYRLQTSDGPCSTKELTRSFGWDDYESFHQHDVTEFNRVLIDTLETKMKGTQVEGMCERLFRGQFINYIKCIHVPFKSTRPEYFYDLQLPVENCPNIYSSFDKYIESEKLEGDNKYQAEGHGLQEAMRGIDFFYLPDVLELNLNRFKHDYYTDTITKINDRFEFYPVIDLKKFLPDDYEKSTVFHLHAVLVHSGTMHGGHYYAYIRPSMDCDWFQFDDETVSRATEKQAIDDNFGHSSHMGYSNAYMLIYVRDSCLEEVFSKLKEEDIPQHLVQKIEQERAEKERRQQEKREAMMYMDVQFVTEENLQKHNPEEFDLVDFTDIERERVRKEFTVEELTAYVADEKGLPAERVRLWNWISRKNNTRRVQKPLSKNYTTFSHVKSLQVFIETSAREEEPYFAPYSPTGAMIFFKFFDLPTGTLSYIGCQVFQRTDQSSSFWPVARRLMNLDESVQLALYEEIKPSRIESISWDQQTLDNLELMSGDIIVVEVDYSQEEREKFPFASTVQFYEDVLNRVSVTFKPKEPREPFVLELSKTSPYEEVARKVAEKLEWEWENLQFSSGHYFKVMPKSGCDLEYMLQLSNDNELSVELLDISVYVLMTLSTYSVTHMNPDTTKKGDTVTVSLKKDGYVSDLLSELEKRLELDGTKQLRLVTLLHHQIDRILTPDLPLSSFNETKQLIVEEVPEEELESEEEESEEREEGSDEDRELDSDDEYISEDGGKKKSSVLMKFGHFRSNSYYVTAYGTPFLMKVKKGETVGEVKERLRVKLGVEEKEFESWKIATVCRSRPSYLEDDDILWREYNRAVDYVGLQHSSNTEPTYTTHHYYHRHREEGIRFKDVEEEEKKE
uniref:Ubiquitin carboxyl-terminal hydrolase n=1 Tax=Paramoeba aestuarina TaxID=180227 RepID=A0A7S4NS50_9EUKA|mmetsp:Transcript_25294/g.39474  ORF Transcript_25294/g.39474 Transcript_25294/m.39474 type:complete len:916 (+) Transcript_25294:1-2748(+)